LSVSFREETEESKFIRKSSISDYLDDDVKNFLKVDDTKTCFNIYNLEGSKSEKIFSPSASYTDESKIKESINIKFFKACEQGNNEKILSIFHKKYHDDRKPDINKKYLHDFTVLHISIINRHNEIVKILLDQGADIESETTMRRRPLHLAVIVGEFDITDFLLSCGAEINSFDTDNNTALHHASRMGHKEIVELLIYKQAKINIKNIYGETPLDIVCNLEIFEVTLNIKFL
jgi:ankyrin repeat protein